MSTTSENEIKLLNALKEATSILSELKNAGLFTVIEDDESDVYFVDPSRVLLIKDLFDDASEEIISRMIEENVT